jgi:PTH1 family peptidyl-tRNA hydrolase
MKLIVGLGNPGSQYRDTRHNVGFDVIAELAKRHLNQRPKAKFDAEVAEIMIASCKCLLISPLTYMNLSGKSVLAAQSFFKTASQDLLIICDDLNLETGKIRFRARGSAGGQNGLKDIIRRLGSSDFSRLKVGIGRPPPRWEASDYVLGKFNDEDRQAIDIAVARSADAVECWAKNGVEVAMNQFNASQPKKKKSNLGKQANLEKPPVRKSDTISLDPKGPDSDSD